MGIAGLTRLRPSYLKTNPLEYMIPWRISRIDPICLKFGFAGPMGQGVGSCLFDLPS
jgi:hypothetical protein